MAKEQENLNQSLIEAVEKKDLTAAKTAITQGADVNTTVSKPEKEFKEFKHASILTYALAKEFYPGAGLLLEANAIFNNDIDGAFIKDIIEADEQHVIDLLLKSGVQWFSVDTKPPYNMIAQAAVKSNQKMIELILSHNIDINLPQKNNKTQPIEFLHYILANPQILDQVLDYSKHDINNTFNSPEMKRTLLIDAVVPGHTETIDYLLKKGADPNISDADEFTALNLAIRNSKYDIVELLLNNGADYALHGKHPENNYFVVINKDHKMIELLQKYNIDVNQPLSDGRLPIEHLPNYDELKTFMLLYK